MGFFKTLFGGHEETAEEKAEICKKYCSEAFEFSAEKPEKQKPIYTIIK